MTKKPKKPAIAPQNVGLAGGKTFTQTRFPTATPPTGIIAPQNEGLPSGTGTYTPTQVIPIGGSTSRGDSSSDSSSGSGTGSGAANPIDWRSYLENWGFPPDVVDELDRIFRSYDADHVNDAAAAALHYIRGTDWYTQTFPGIQEGEKLGIVSNEQDYRSYLNQLNDVYHRYYSRDVTSKEMASFLKQGWTVPHVNAHFQGQAYVAANKANFQYQLGAFGEGSNSTATEGELSALGDQSAGLDNSIGQIVQRRLDLAKQRFTSIFSGSDATPNMALSNVGRLVASSYGKAINAQDIPS